jgi:hypothetical protein
MPAIWPAKKGRNRGGTMRQVNRLEQLHDVLDAEYAISRCFGRLSALIKNGRIRNRFITFAEAARNNQRLLKERLAELGAEEEVEERACHLCKINPESFSLRGALNLGMELTNKAGVRYKELVSSAATEEDERLYGTLMKEKHGQHGFLKKEKKFVHKEEDDFSLIDSYCIDEVISKLWT